MLKLNENVVINPGDIAPGQYPGYYPSSQMAYHDFDGDEVNYIFNGISFKIKPTGFDFYFKPTLQHWDHKHISRIKFNLEEFLSNQEPLGEEFERVLHANLDELYQN